MLARLWLQREWRNFLPAIFAVGFSCLMLVVQAALVLGIFGSAAVYIDRSDADLWIGRPNTQSVNFGQPIGMDVESMVRAHPDTQTVEPYLWVEGNWQRVHDQGAAVPVYVSGIVPDSKGLMFSKLLTTQMRTALRVPGAVIVDRADLTQLDALVGDRAWINGKPVDIVQAVSGLRALGGVNVVASSETARTLDPDSSTHNRPTYLVLSVRDGAQPDLVKKALSDKPGVGAYEVWTADEFASRSQRYWLLDTGAGIAVMFMAAIVLMVGAVVTGQALVAVVMHVRPEFAMLIALGVSRGVLCRVVLMLAMLIGVIGALFGGLASVLVLALATTQDVPVAMTSSVAWSCGLAVLLLASCSGLFAMRGVLHADPASLLR